MRRAFRKLKFGKMHTFQGVVANVAYERQVIKNVSVFLDGSCTTSKFLTDHCLVAKKPFKNIPQGTPVRFSGKLRRYIRPDGTMDYSLIVNKAKQVQLNDE